MFETTSDQQKRLVSAELRPENPQSCHVLISQVLRSRKVASIC